MAKTTQKADTKKPAEAKHAILSPSGASRWLACTPSARLELLFPDKAGEAAAEGTLAHRLGEAIIRLQSKMISGVEYKKELKAIQADPLYDNSMMEHAENYAVFVLERFAAAKAHTPDARIYIETRLDLGEYVPEGFGTADAAIVADGVLDFVDLKYGKGVEVSAKENKQMMLYSLGLLSQYGMFYDIHTVRMTIYQPRMDNISKWEISKEDLLKWAEEELVPKAKDAFEGRGEFIAGKHCQFCRARPTCRAHYEMQIQLAQYDFKAPPLLMPDEVADILARSKDFNSWTKEVNDFALHQSVTNGVIWPGFKLVEGRSNRMYTDEEGVLQAVEKSTGFPRKELMKPSEIIGITEMEKLIGKKVFADLLSPFVAKPPGKPTLAPVDDPRPVYAAKATVEEDFAEEYRD